MFINDNGEIKEVSVKTLDTLPVGAEIDYVGTTVPDGWEEVEVEEVKSVYSTVETKTNKIWINNKPIYRKVLNFTNIPTGGKICSHGINNLEQVVFLQAIYYASDFGFQPIPICNPGASTSYSMGIGNVNATSIQFEVGTARSTTNNVYVIIEYTKV